MNTFLSYAIPGIPFGCTYAIVAMGLVLTYRTTGVFNFGFGAQAFVSAFVYTVLTGDGVSVLASFLISVVVLGPLLGWVLDRFLFRRIAATNTTAKMVSAVAVLVGLPELLSLVFGSATRFAPPTLFLDPGRVYFHVFSTPINGLELETITVTAAVVLVLRRDPALATPRPDDPGRGRESPAAGARGRAGRLGAGSVLDGVEPHGRAGRRAARPPVPHAAVR